MRIYFGVFPDRATPIVRNGKDSVRELVMDRCSHTAPLLVLAQHNDESPLEVI